MDAISTENDSTYNIYHVKVYLTNAPNPYRITYIPLMWLTPTETILVLVVERSKALMPHTAGK
jgi:hypothetical protein